MEYCSLTRNTPRLANIEMAYSNGWPTSLRLNLAGAAWTMMHGQGQRIVEVESEQDQISKTGGLFFPLCCQTRRHGGSTVVYSASGRLIVK